MKQEVLKQILITNNMLNSLFNTEDTGFNLNHVNIKNFKKYEK